MAAENLGTEAALQSCCGKGAQPPAGIASSLVPSTPVSGRPALPWVLSAAALPAAYASADARKSGLAFIEKHEDKMDAIIAEDFANPAVFKF